MLMKMDVIAGMSQQMQYVSVSVLHPPKKIETCDSQTVISDLRPRGKGRKRVWQGAKHDAENADVAKFAAGGDMPTVSAGGLRTSQPGGS